LIINDIEHLNTIKFNYVVLDESQAIKNTDSLRYKAVMLLKAKNRLAMTGTPVENNTFDLYAQMNFTNPGLLGNVNHFKKNFSDLIDKKGDQEAATLLRKIVQPFLLRRTKDQVAKDLPNKTEDVIYCEMGSEQRKVYNAFRDNYRNLIGKKIDTEGLGKSSMIVLDALLKLRQICNSPALLNTKESYGNDSVKIEELVSHLTEKTGNHKVLVFSQFVEMLKLIEKELTKQNIPYEYLDGQTRKREEKVKRFQEEQSCRVFLISIKAGGVGLNLTQADYVYIVDPWWNPAVEAQAIDRTHRIGQTKKVFAYRMICKDTTEEKILQLQQKKKKVSEDVISADAAFYKQLEKEDILDLFS
jgi:SNF2 family DNA or RNA helicase